jgi:hypothetical protein
MHVRIGCPDSITGSSNLAIQLVHLQLGPLKSHGKWQLGERQWRQLDIHGRKKAVEQKSRVDGARHE